MDRRPPSPLPRSPVAGLRNKAAFPFLPTLVSRKLAFEWRAARPGFSNITLRGSGLMQLTKIPRDREKYLELSPDGKAASEKSGFFCIRGVVEGVFVISI